MSSIDQLIAQLKAASKLSGDGSVNGVFAVKWEFVVTVGLDEDEIESLDEESLRSALGAQVDEMVSMTREASDAITIDALYEVRDGWTDKDLCLKYELALRGFDGGTDATDDRIIAVKAPMSLEDLTAFIKQDPELAIDIQGIASLPDGYIDEAIDFRIPESLASLKARISEILAD